MLQLGFLAAVGAQRRKREGSHVYSVLTASGDTVAPTDSQGLWSLWPSSVPGQRDSRAECLIITSEPPGRLHKPKSNRLLYPTL